MNSTLHSSITIPTQFLKTSAGARTRLVGSLCLSPRANQSKSQLPHKQALDQTPAKRRKALRFPLRYFVIPQEYLQQVVEKSPAQHRRFDPLMITRNQPLLLRLLKLL